MNTFIVIVENQLPFYISFLNFLILNLNVLSLIRSKIHLKTNEIAHLQ